jgi:hypothetical protein
MTRKRPSATAAVASLGYYWGQSPCFGKLQLRDTPRGIADSRLMIVDSPRPERGHKPDRRHRADGCSFRRTSAQIHTPRKLTFRGKRKLLLKSILSPEPTLLPRHPVHASPGKSERCLTSTVLSRRLSGKPPRGLPRGYPPPCSPRTLLAGHPKRSFPRLPCPIPNSNTENRIGRQAPTASPGSPWSLRGKPGEVTVEP